MARYQDAIAWIVYNDDIEWLDEEKPESIISVTACLVADLFNKEHPVVIADLKKAAAKMDAEHEQQDRRWN